MMMRLTKLIKFTSKIIYGKYSAKLIIIPRVLLTPVDVYLFDYLFKTKIFAAILNRKYAQLRYAFSTLIIFSLKQHINIQISIELSP